MYKNNSGLIAKTKVSKYKKGLCLTEKLVSKNPLLFLYQTVMQNGTKTERKTESWSELNKKKKATRGIFATNSEFYSKLNMITQNFRQALR